MQALKSERKRKFCESVLQVLKHFLVPGMVVGVAQSC